MFFNRMKIMLVIGVCSISTNKALPLTNPSSNFNEDKIESVSKILLTRSLADLLVSEYNQVISTNMWLYALSSDPYVTCKEDNYATCVIFLQLAPTTCSRLSDETECSLRNDPKGKKMCAATVSLMEARPKGGLLCLSKNRGTFSVHDKGNSNVAENELEMASLKAMEPWKRWDENGGNPYPI